ARVVYLAEESSRSLKQKIARFGIEPGNIRALTRREAFPRRALSDVIEAAVQEARAFGAAVVIVDTVAFWASLEQDQEQDSGVMNQLAGVLQKAAVEGGVAVLAIHHDRKGDAIGLDAMRGSSAWGA